MSRVVFCLTDVQVALLRKVASAPAIMPDRGYYSRADRSSIAGLVEKGLVKEYRLTAAGFHLLDTLGYLAQGGFFAWPQGALAQSEGVSGGN